ncbi:MAG: DNA mismatch repair protein [Myxococcota bacterium]
MRRARPAELADESDAPRAFAPRAAPEGWLDLLHETPTLTADPQLLRSAMRFGFESGDAGGLLSAAGGMGPSRFADESELAGLFVPRLVEGLMAIPTDEGLLVPDGAVLAQTLLRPTNDPDDRSLRHGVLAELVENDALQQPLVECLVTLREMRDLLDDRPMTTGETVKRKIELLTTVRRFFEQATGFASANSALGRLGRYATEVRELPVWSRLVDLLRQESQATELRVRLVLDYGGKIRDYEVLERKHDADNPLVRSPWRRLWERILGFLRGHRFGEHEVILRILDDIFEGFEDALLPCFSLIHQLEFYAAALAFRARAQAADLQVGLPTFESGGDVELAGLFNPLLLLVDGVKPVPCELTLREDAMVLVTGPNSGGKTRMLQAVAMAQLFGQAGFFVPAERARLVAAPKMFVSLIESAPADHKEGRLGTELMRVRRLFERLEPGALVILDELCSGTNPSEGIAIFEMVLGLLPRAKPRALMTTHFLDAARRLEGDAGADLQFLQVELTKEETPTYQFVPGVAPTSLAHAVAARLGVTQEELESLADKAAGSS